MSTKYQPPLKTSKIALTLKKHTYHNSVRSDHYVWSFKVILKHNTVGGGPINAAVQQVPQYYKICICKTKADHKICS